MNALHIFNIRNIRAALVAFGLAMAVMGQARAELADLANVPLANSPSDAVLPNLMFIIDDSGSMMWDYMPDNVQALTDQTPIKNCKSCSNGSTCTTAAIQCALGNPGDPDLNLPGSPDGATAEWGEPPYFSPQFNQIYYNPDVSYAAGVDAAGNTLGNSSVTAARKDYYLNTTTVNLTTTYPDIYYCTSSVTQFTAKISGTVLTVSAIASGTLGTLRSIGGEGVLPGTFISSVGSVNGAGIGTYNLSVSQNLSSRSMTAATAAQLADTTVCKRNGINNIQTGNNNYFLYWSTNITAGTPFGAYPVATGTTSTSFRFPIVTKSAGPYYFKIAAHEYCTDTNLVECKLANADGSAPSGTGTDNKPYAIPAPIRYCGSAANASSTAVMSDALSVATPKCRKKFDDTNYKYPRYGRFTRVNVLATTTSYPLSTTAIRPDCASPSSCTYAEETQNFANWYTYYRTRMAMMKTATGRAFLPIDDRYRVGFITINPGSPVSSDRFLALGTFSSGQKTSFYELLYEQTNHGSTPLREALSRVGRHYAGVTNGINNGMGADPITHSCQQNFALLTTDGYWNDDSSDARDTSTSGTVGNQDNVATTTLPVFVDRPTVTLDGVGTQTRDVTPSVELTQILCSDDTSVLGGTNNCDCATGKKRIKQRTRNLTQTVDKTDDIETSNTTATTSTSYQNITAVCNSKVDTRTIVTTQTMQQRCAGTATVNFGDAYGSVACGCTGTNRRVKQRVVTLTRVIVTNDGITTSDVTTPSNPIYSNSTALLPNGSPLGACQLAAVPLTAGPTLVSNPTASDNTSSTGVQITNSNITISPNPTVTAGTTTTTTTGNGGSSNTLADVAMYYYKKDLRTGAPTSKSANNVPTTDKDVTDQQHMVTFTLGLGLQGLMDYTSDYESNASSDYAKIKNADTTCAWSPTAGATCNWPTPASGDPSTLDDLWHAAVNGRGIYYSASDPNTLADGLAGALSALKIQTAAASASATSSPNITETDNYIYSSTFRTVRWDGEITAQRIDTATGSVLPAVVWSAQAKLDAKVATAEALTTPGDGRTIWTFDALGANKLRAFEYSLMTAAEKAYFDNKCPDLSQCPLLTTTQKADANDGNNMVNFLRGRTTFEASVYRDREHVLGDPVNATPAFVQAPRNNFNDAVTPTYADFKVAKASRQGVLYIAANDGMIHAFNGDNGNEMWTYVPRMVFPKLHSLATDNWDVRHEFLVDGSPQIMDVFDSSAGAWKTVLVAGLGKGGRGYYAIDITNPATPKGMWEACSDATLCAIQDDDFGFSYGYPVITKRTTDGKWVVLLTSGMNNVSPGTGRGYLYVVDVLTGAILRKVNTAAGDVTTPAGLSKVSAFANNFNIDNTATYVYGGDLLGNLWRFDMNVDPPTVLKLAELKDSTGKPQSITTRPELSVIDGSRVIYVGTGRYLGEDDLSDPGTLTPPLNWAYQQSFYAIKDRSTALGNIRTSSPGLQQQTITILSSTSRSTSSTPVDWSGKDGWFVDFNPSNDSPGERVNLDPLLALGTLVLVTNVPNNNACTVGGDSWIYQLDYRNGTYIASAANNQAGQKFTGQTLVGVVVVRLPSGVLKAIATGATGTKTPVGVNIGGGGSSGRRVSWRELFE